MGGDMQKKPPYFDKAQEYKLNEETIELPKILPPDYFKILEENGIEETVRPTSAPCFSDFDARRPWKGIAVQ